MSLLLLFWEDITNPLPVTPALPTTNIASFIERHINISVQTSAFFSLERATFPRVNILRGGNSLHTINTCLDRIETSLYDLHCYSNRSLEEINSIFSDLEDIYDFSTLSVGSKLLTGFHWNSKQIQEIEPGLFHGILSFEILAERHFSLQNNIRDSTDGSTLLNCLFNRWQSQQQLLDIGPFVTTKYQIERTKPPYTSIPILIGSYEGHTTNSRYEQYDFQFETICHSLEQGEEINEKIMDVYDYSHCRIVGDYAQRHMINMSWAGDNVIELEPGIWMASVVYQAMLEKYIW